MFNSTVFDIVLGMVFIYLVLSLICTAAKEFIEGLTRMRANDLERGLKELLQDPTATGLVTQIYQHPLIDSLFQGDYSPDPKRRKQIGSQLPTYIPARNFALALMNLIETDAHRSAAQAAGAPTAPAPRSIASLQQAIDESPLLAQNTQVQQALRTLVHVADLDLNQARANIEGWFNSAMDRVSGWYKRRTQFIVAFLGILLVVAANADTFAIGDALARDKALREALVNSSSEYEKLTAAKGQQPLPPEKWSEAKVREFVSLGLPLGWSRTAFYETDPWVWIKRVLGWMVTTLAISLGAPFWFDVLNKIMVIRSTVKPHEKSPEEKSRD